ncbi:MAG: type II secretion system inner membrane protein GspF [Sulfuriflexus sp.]|nr:type II secretion system inner membrane protein GspF [Sulfuriflexus sp.]
MSAFEYTALDTGGKKLKGVIEGDAPRQVRQQLRDQGLTPLTVDEVRQRIKSDEKKTFSRGISSTELAVFTRQLATLVGSGMPLEETLDAVGKQTENPRMQSTIVAVRSRIKEGHSLADALADFPVIFPELYRSTVAAGEQTGHLDVVLSRLADYTENRQMLIQSISQALIYPAVLTFTALAVVILLLGYVVPQVVQVFTDLGQTLPWLTRALIATSDVVRDYGWLMAIIIVAAVFAWRRALQNEAIKYRYHAWLLKLPLVARLVRGVNTARFARTFSILTASGVPVLEGLRISANVMGNLPMREAVLEASLRVREGSTVQKALEASDCFPPLVLHLIGSGESSGKLEDMLERAAQNQERDLENRISMLMKIFEPALILVMGVVVLVIVLAILLPIFDLNQLVK